MSAKSFAAPGGTRLAGAVWIVRLLAISMMFLPGCYLATRVGPSYTTANGVSLEQGGVDWQVTAGIEATWPTHDASRLFDPFSGRAHCHPRAPGERPSAPCPP
jgi:hypothetical protein